jgi:hypothetical protein
MTRSRLAIECSKNPPTTEDGSLDRDKLIESVKESATEELKYLESVTGTVTGGKVVGMTTPVGTELKEADVDADLTKAWQSFGLNEKESATAANGRY